MGSWGGEGEGGRGTEGTRVMGKVREGQRLRDERNCSLALRSSTLKWTQRGARGVRCLDPKDETRVGCGVWRAVLVWGSCGCLSQGQLSMTQWVKCCRLVALPVGLVGGAHRGGPWPGSGRAAPHAPYPNSHEHSHDAATTAHRARGQSVRGGRGVGGSAAGVGGACPRLLCSPARPPPSHRWLPHSAMPRPLASLYLL